MNLLTQIKDARKKIAIADQALTMLEADLSRVVSGVVEPQLLIIQQAVCEHFNLPLTVLTSDLRPDQIVFPRQMAMRLALDLTDLKPWQIGAAFAKGRSAVQKAGKAFALRISQNPAQAKDYALVRQSVETRLNSRHLQSVA